MKRCFKNRQNENSVGLSLYMRMHKKFVYEVVREDNITVLKNTVKLPA